MISPGKVANSAVRRHSVPPRPVSRPEGIHEYLQTKYTLTPDPFA